MRAVACLLVALLSCETRSTPGKLFDLGGVVVPEKKILSIEGRSVRTLEPLKEMTGLRQLSLDGTSVESFQGLENLDALEYLSLRNTAFADADLRLLKNQSRLSYLDISGTNVSSLEPLAKMPNLQILRAADLSIRTPLSLDRLASLEGLDFSRCAPLPALKQLPRLKWLRLAGVAPQDLSTLPDGIGRLILSKGHSHQGVDRYKARNPATEVELE